MSIFISVIVLILAMLIPFFMQFVPGVFALFYHYSLGKTTTQKADDKSLSFIIGAEFFNAAIWLLIYFLAFLFFYNVPGPHDIFFYIMAGIFIAEAIAVLFFYYRKGKSTALFIPRSITNGIIANIKKNKTRSDCIVLGAMSGLFELIFTLPAIIISTSILTNFETFPSTLIIVISIVMSVLPLFIVRGAFRLNHNLAEIERVRVKIKPFIKFILFFSFLFLAAATIYLGAHYG